MKTLVIFTIGVVISLTRIDAKVYSECGLAKALLGSGMPRDQLQNWVCLVESESSRNSAAKGGPNSDGSYDYGLFQLNNRYWCKEGYPGGECHVDCYKLLDDNLSDDTKCAKLIFKGSGFGAWNGWKAKCQGALPDLSKCNI